MPLLKLASYEAGMRCHHAWLLVLWPVPDSLGVEQVAIGEEGRRKDAQSDTTSCAAALLLEDFLAKRLAE